MRDLKIALGRSADSLKWTNSTISWEKLCEKLKTTLRTRETVAEYHAMSRDDKEKAKDIGGHVCVEPAGIGTGDYFAGIDEFTHVHFPP